MIQPLGISDAQQTNDLEGIGGWLILVAIGVVMTPLRILMLLVGTYPRLFSDGTWQALTTPSSENYDPLWEPILLGELVTNMALLVASIYTAYLFFSKKAKFPKWFIGIALFTFVFIIVDAFAVKLAQPDEPVFDSDTTGEALRSLISIMIWVPYMRVSERVKATFVT